MRFARLIAVILVAMLVFVGCDMSDIGDSFTETSGEQTVEATSTPDEDDEWSFGTSQDGTDDEWSFGTADDGWSHETLEPDTSDDTGKGDSNTTDKPDTTDKEDDTDDVGGTGTLATEFMIYSIEMKGDQYGDSNIIKYGNFDILVDGGNTADSPNVRDALGKYVTDGVLDMLIISHPHTDHLNGLIKRDTYKYIDDIEMIVHNGNTFGSALSTFKSDILPMFPNAEYISVQEVMKDAELKNFEVDSEFSVNFLYHSYYDNPNNASKGANERSIAFTVNYKNTVLFMGGDMPSNACDELMKANPNLFTEDQFVIFKALHHASRGSNKDNFLNYIKADLCFVNTAVKLSSDQLPNFAERHPHIEAMERIGKYTTEVYWSGINGSLTITCDGYGAEVDTAGRTGDYYYKTNTQGKTMADRADERYITFFESKYWLMAITTEGCKDFAGILN